MSGRTASGRKLIKRACDACKVRKIKCSELSPCDGCRVAGIQCTFKRIPSTRGPRSLRPKTVLQIKQRQRLSLDDGDDPARSFASPDVTSTLLSKDAGTTLAQDPGGTSNQTTSVASLVLRLCVYRLRLFPVWPIVAVDDIIATLQRDEGNMGTYALANAIGAATMAQLKLDSLSDAVMASTMESECQRARGLDTDGRHASLNTLRIAFFLHVYHENQDAGGVQSLLYLREAITLAQIIGLHRESNYAALSFSEQEIRRRIIWLLFVTERGVAMLHKLPVVLKCDTRFPSTDCDDGSHVLPAFRKLVNLFWIFDQSGAFDLLQNTDTDGFNMGDVPSVHQNSLEILQQRLRNEPIDWESSSDVQRADICVTRQWMRAVLWRTSLNRNSNSDQVTSLSHPIQIAKEFLAVIKTLPSTAIEAHGPSIEFKIFEIASAVADAIASSIRGWTFSENARDVLDQLHRILLSCRGGNVTLASMLQSKIAQIRHQQPLLLEPSSRIEEVSEHWLNQIHTSAGLNFKAGNLRRTTPPLYRPSSPQDDREESHEARRRGFEYIETLNEGHLEGRKLPWSSTINEELTTTYANSSDLYEQLQNFDESFDAFQSFDNLVPFLSDNGIVHSLTGDGLSNNFTPSAITS